MKYLFLFSLFLSSFGSFANDSIIINRLLQRIEQLQVKESGIFPKGSIPSYRMYALNKHSYKADINPFFTALTSFTLQDIKHYFSPEQQDIANNIINHTSLVYPKFKNKKNNRDTYNFWTADKPIIFPYSGWLNLFNKSKSLPDDMDDTVMILMALNNSDSVASVVHRAMQNFTNSEKKSAVNTYPEYRKINAYSTWFGVKMPIELDVNVLTNVLYFVQHYNLPWTSADSASLSLITDILKTRRHITASGYVSPQYATLPLILYHVSRLMSVKSISSLELLKPQLIEEAKNTLARSTNFMEKVILSTSLLRWGVNPPEINISTKETLIDLIEDDTFYYFIANMGSIMPDSLKKILTKTKIGTFYYYCPAFNHLLVLENLVWRRRNTLKLN